MKTEVMFSKKSDEWETPQDFFDELDKEFAFDIDVCATAENKKTLDFLSKEINGLDVDWKLLGELNYDKDLVAWMNPPYSEIKKWIAKAYNETSNGVTTVCLVPSRTDTKWFHEYCYNKPNVEIRFIKGRLKFGGSLNSAPFPSMIIIFRPQ